MSAPTEAAPPLAPHWQLVIVATLAGLAFRGVSIYFAPQNSYIPDHIANMAWARYAAQHGPWNLYDMPLGWPLMLRAVDLQNSALMNVPVHSPHDYNYPPGSAWVFGLSGLAWQWLDGVELDGRVHPQNAARYQLPPTFRSPLLDTHASRFANALPGVVADFALALAVAWLVRRTQSPHLGPMPAAAAYAVTLVAPPIFLDSAFWTQADSWVMAPLVAVLAACLAGRWAVAGAAYGLAAMLKPQAILLGPVLAFLVLAHLLSPERRFVLPRLMRFLSSTAVVIAILAAPVMLADRDAPGGPWRWLQRSYGETVGDSLYHQTTLSAFNLWWIDWMASGATRETLDAARPLAGVRRDVIGKILLACAVVAAFAIALTRWRRLAGAGLICAFLVTFAAFVLPTRVHERYIYYCLPFAIALAAVDWKRWLGPLLALLLVGAAEMLSFRWLPVPGGALYGTILAGLTLATFATSLILALLPSRSRFRPLDSA